MILLRLKNSIQKLEIISNSYQFYINNSFFGNKNNIISMNLN